MATIKKVKKAQTGKIQGRGTSGDYYNIDTSGYAAGAKKFPAEVVRPRLIGKAKELSKEISRKKVEQALKKKPITDSPSGFKKGGSIKKKMQAGGVAGKSPKAPMVDPNGAYTKVQERTLGNMKKGGTVKDKKWIQKAVNPKHKGYCTPMTKATCTPKRKALAKTLKKMAKARKG